MRHLPNEERLQRRRLQADLITALKIFTGLLDIDPNLFFLPPARSDPRVHPYKVLRGASHRRMRGSAFSVRVVKYWNKLPALVVTAPSVNVLKKVWTETFSHLPHWLNRHLSIFLPPPTVPSAHCLLTVIISICYQTPCFRYVVSSGPLWPTFYHYKS